MDTMQPARPAAPGHRLPTQAKPYPLGKGDDSMLPGGELGEPPIHRGSLNFVNSWLTNFTDPRHRRRGSQTPARLWVASVTRL